MIGVKELTGKLKTQGLELDGGKFEPKEPSALADCPRWIAYGADPADTTYGFEDEVNR